MQNNRGQNRDISSQSEDDNNNPQNLNTYNGLEGSNPPRIKLNTNMSPLATQRNDKESFETELSYTSENKVKALSERLDSKEKLDMNNEMPKSVRVEVGPLIQSGNSSNYDLQDIDI